MNRWEENRQFVMEFVRLAIPMAFQRLVVFIIQLIDNLMIGSLGEMCISGVAVSGTFNWLCTTFSQGMADGAVILAAQEYGRDNKPQIRKLLSFVLTVNLGIGLFFFVLISLFPRQILSIYTDVPGIIEEGLKYINIVKFSIPLGGLSFAVVTILHSTRNVKLGMVSSITSCFANMFFNWVFIFGNLGAPVMGVEGAALGTLLAKIVEFLIVFGYLLFMETNLNFRISDYMPKLEKDYLYTLMKVTIPIMVIDVLSNLVTSAQTIIVGHISENYITSNSIVHTTWTLPSVFCMGLGVAAGIMMGNRIGAKDMDTVKNHARKFVVTSFGMGIINCGIMNILLPIIAGFYEISQATLDLTYKMGRVASLTVVFVCMNFVVCNGVIKAGGDTGNLLKVDLIFNWLVAIPLGYLAAFHLGCPPEYLYFILRLGIVLKVIWGVWQIYTDRWLKNIVN